ncbi:hypothetical protein [Bradyrhizobium liaoningense]|uniref:hypothetical protein n=1 Tax=Bradyrhizobium liaoningense TaxID=43992 RepID=UPI001BA8F0A8|nr:hypothetical protein [Bradyrhizobium liaoningense]MBR0820208.1 hypothetical protein [Bradyrhizobium liaoningense]
MSHHMMEGAQEARPGISQYIDQLREIFAAHEDDVASAVFATRFLPLKDYVATAVDQDFDLRLKRAGSLSQPIVAESSAYWA